jgi:putative membrane protein
MFSQPALNAALNATSAVLLAGGYAAIKAGKVQVHKRFMVSAFWISVVFLVSYVYFTLLLSHTILAIAIVPMILVTLRRAWMEKFDKHRIIARWTLPLWFYVCVTGVIVYFMVYQIYATG